MTTADPAGPKVHPGCTCGKGRVGGLLCWPCFKKYDDERPLVTVDSGGVHFHPRRH